MKFLDAAEAYVLEAAAGQGTGEAVDTTVVHRLVHRGLMAYADHPTLVTETAVHYQITMTANGWMLLNLYRSGIR